jgi:hypothetical protein
MFRSATKRELTQLRRSFDLWGIFEFMESQVILIKADRTNRSKDMLITRDFKRYSQLSDSTSQTHRLSNRRATQQEIHTLITRRRANCEVWEKFPICIGE